MRILVGVDGSRYSDAAINEVAARVLPAQSEIRLITAFELPLSPSPEVWLLPPDYFECVDRAVRTHAESVLAAAVAKLKAAVDPSIKISGTVQPGSPRSVILDEAERWKADLIVVGSHGYTLWHRFLLGSVSQAVVSHAKCSVEVVRLADKVDAEKIKVA